MLGRRCICAALNRIHRYGAGHLVFRLPCRTLGDLALTTPRLRAACTGLLLVLRAAVSAAEPTIES